MDIRSRRDTVVRECSILPSALCSSSFTIRSLLLCSLFLVLCSSLSDAVVYDPLGNRIFEGKGEQLYSIDATYGLIEGGAVARREKKFRDQLKSAYVSFTVGGNEELRHKIIVGGFRTEFSSFALNKRQSDAIGWEVSFPESRGKMYSFISKLTNTTLGKENRTLESSSDWYMAGLRGEANLGIWDISVGNRDFGVELPSIGVSYVNKYFTNYDLTRTSNPFGGADRDYTGRSDHPHDESGRRPIPPSSNSSRGHPNM